MKAGLTLILAALLLLPGCVTEETTTTTLSDSKETTTTSLPDSSTSTSTTTTTTTTAADFSQRLEECRRMAAWTDANDCIKNLAAETRNRNLCEMIMQNPNMPATTMWSITMYHTAKSSCYIQIAVATLDESLCSEADKYSYGTGGRAAQDCYVTVAAAKGDTAVCELMRYGEEKDKCIGLITEAASKGEKAKTCVDSDGGVDEKTKGYVLAWRGEKNEDACISDDGRLMEYVCKEDTYSISVSAPEFIECVGGRCEGGRCVSD